MFMGAVAWLGAIIMFGLLGALTASQPWLLVMLIPMALVIRWGWKRFVRWTESGPAKPPQVSLGYDREWLLTSQAAKDAGLYDAYMAEIAAKRKAKKHEHDDDEPITIGGHVRHGHFG